MRCLLLVLVPMCVASGSFAGRVAADLTYDILPQTLINETTNEEEFIFGGVLTLVDGEPMGTGKAQDQIGDRLRRVIDTA